LINDREPIAGHSDEARHTDRRFHPVWGGGPVQLHPRRLWEQSQRRRPHLIFVTR